MIILFKKKKRLILLLLSVEKGIAMTKSCMHKKSLVTIIYTRNTVFNTMLLHVFMIG